MDHVRVLYIRLSEDFHAFQDCEFTYIHQIAFNYHKISKHTEPTLQCQHCDKIFSDKKLHRDHVNSHDPTKQKFQCQMCDKKFHRNSLLTVSLYMMACVKGLVEVKSSLFSPIGSYCIML